MSLKKNLSILDRIYDIYNQYAAQLNPVCQKGCVECCTRNVTMTTLEGYKIACFLESGKREDLLSKLEEASTQNRFIPQITTNRLADLCIDGEEVPEEVLTPMEEKCIFLEENACAIYPVRPFGCRCLVSGKNCEETGYASVDPFTMTVSTLLLQYIEHIDVHGAFANLIDILMLLKHQEGRRAYEQETLTQTPMLLQNRPVRLLLVPPEHRERLAPMLTLLQEIVH